MKSDLLLVLFTWSGNKFEPIFYFIFLFQRPEKKKMIVGNIIWFIVLKHPRNEVERV